MVLKLDCEILETRAALRERGTCGVLVVDVEVVGVCEEGWVILP